jgi:hypothetical protein
MKDEHKEDYERGKQDAKNADFGDELFHGLGEVIDTVVPSSDKHKTYEAGWKDGMEEKSGCFITTACIKTKGLPDNCQELNELRQFRDEYVRNLPNGTQLIHEYYNIAPQIVAGINSSEDLMKVYEGLYEKLVTNLELIRSGKKGEALRNGLEIINELRENYL